MKTRLLLKLILVIAATFSALCAFGVEKVVEFDFTTQYSTEGLNKTDTYLIYDCDISEEIHTNIFNKTGDISVIHDLSSISYNGVNLTFYQGAKFCIEKKSQNNYYTAPLQLYFPNNAGVMSCIKFSGTNNSTTIKEVKVLIEGEKEKKYFLLFQDEDKFKDLKSTDWINLTDTGESIDINNVIATLYTIPQEYASENMYLRLYRFENLNIYKITVTIECEEGGEEEEDDEEEEIVVEEHDPLKGYEVGAEVNLGLLQVVKSGDKYIYATYGTEYYILTSTNAASYGANSKINAVGTKVIDETLQLPVVQLAENEALPTSTYVSIKDINAEMMFKYVEVEHVNIANGAISDDNGSIAINDIFSICPDSKPDCNVIGIVAKKPAVPSQASKKRATAESELAIIPTEVISNGTISSAPVAPKDSNIKVKGSTITVADCADYEIIDLNGRIIACNRPATNCSPGLYFVKTPSTTHKVLIK